MGEEFISGCCRGEMCRCGNPAVKKVEEHIFDDDPDQMRHPYVAYVCKKHFNEIMGIKRATPIGDKIKLADMENLIPRNKPYVHKADDGSILMEWCFKDWRMGIAIEKNPEESSWYVVARNDTVRLPLGGISELLSKEFLDIIKMPENAHVHKFDSDGGRCSCGLTAKDLV